jgi:hypothetical protein
MSEDCTQLSNGALVSPYAGQAYKLRSGDRIQLGTEGTCVQVQFQEVSRVQAALAANLLLSSAVQDHLRAQANFGFLLCPIIVGKAACKHTYVECVYMHHSAAYGTHSMPTCTHIDK